MPHIKRTRRVARRNSPVHMGAAVLMNEHRDGRQNDALFPLYFLWAVSSVLMGTTALAIAEHDGLTPTAFLAGALGASVPSLVMAVSYALTYRVPASLAAPVTEVSVGLRKLARFDVHAARRGRAALIKLLKGLERPDASGHIEDEDLVAADIVSLAETVLAHLEKHELAEAHANVPLREHDEAVAVDAEERRRRAKAERYAAARADAAAFGAERSVVESDIDWYREHSDQRELVKS